MKNRSSGAVDGPSEWAQESEVEGLATNGVKHCFYRLTDTKQKQSGWLILVGGSLCV